MNTGGDAAEQIVRMSLEGYEVSLKLLGSGAKNVAVLLYSILKEEKKTKGKARLTSMLRLGKELKVFTVKNSDLKKFTQEAKKYGVLYCVLADRKNGDPNAEVDVIARAEDASKINRIVERFHLASTDNVTVITEPERETEIKQQEPNEKQAETDEIVDELMGEEKEQTNSNPHGAKTEQSPLSEPTSKPSSNIKEGITNNKPSVKEELRRIISSRSKQEDKKTAPKKPKEVKKPAMQTVHKQPKKKKRKYKGER